MACPALEKTSIGGLRALATNSEFPREGPPWEDALKPDGLVTDLRAEEMIRYTTKASSANGLANRCDAFDSLNVNRVVVDGPGLVPPVGHVCTVDVVHGEIDRAGCIDG